MQGVRPIGADNKIFLSEQAPTEYFIIHSCMSHSNSKMLAISTFKHLSRNYASFQQPSVQEWYSLSTSGQTQSIFKRNTADFHGDGYFLQNAGFTKGLRIAFVVYDVNSEYRRIQESICKICWSLLPTILIIQNALFDIAHENRTASHTLNPTETTHFFISTYKQTYLALFRYT